ncbi:MAG: VanZ family protein [Opitutales bacterium]|jgi:VanZ family protein
MAEQREVSRWRLRLVHGLYAVLIITISGVPGSDLPEATSLVSDKVLHFGEYGLLGLLGGWAYLGKRKHLWLILLFGLAFAGLDEFRQSFVPQRESDLFDFLVDLVGHVTGVLTACFLRRRSA